MQQSLYVLKELNMAVQARQRPLLLLFLLFTSTNMGCVLAPAVTVQGGTLLGASAAALANTPEKLQKLRPLSTVGMS